MTKEELVGYLTEQKLFSILCEIYGIENISKQYRLPNKKIVDYKVHNGAEIIFVEFDGYRHYTEAATITRDINNQHLVIADSNIRIAHIPYWLQEDFIRRFYFRNQKFIKSQYPNGFVDKKCVRPIDFNMMGWERFIYELNNIPDAISEQVLTTLSIDELTIYNRFINTYDHIGVGYSELDWFRGCVID